MRPATISAHNVQWFRVHAYDCRACRRVFHSRTKNRTPAKIFIYILFFVFSAVWVWTMRGVLVLLLLLVLFLYSFFASFRHSLTSANWLPMHTITVYALRTRYSAYTAYPSDRALPMARRCVYDYATIKWTNFNHFDRVRRTVHPMKFIIFHKCMRTCALRYMRIIMRRMEGERCDSSKPNRTVIMCYRQFLFCVPPCIGRPAAYVRSVAHISPIPRSPSGRNDGSTIYRVYIPTYIYSK